MTVISQILTLNLLRYAPFNPRTSKPILLHHPRQNNTGHNPGNRRQNRTCKRIPCFRHFCCHIVYGHRVKNCLRTTHHNRCCHSNQGIRSMIFKNIKYQPCCCRRRKKEYNTGFKPIWSVGKMSGSRQFYLSGTSGNV